PRVLRQDAPEDYGIATGAPLRVREFLEVAFSHAGLKWEDRVVSDPRFLRPAEVELLSGDAPRARTRLGWQPTVSFPALVARMVDHDIRLQEAALRRGVEEL